jgi:hypothetical protein
MKTFVIRELGDDSGALVGTARVFDLQDLWHTMDEFGNPHAFEYLRVSGTCVFCKGEYGWQVNEGVAIQLPLTAEEREDLCEDDRDVGSWKTIVDLCGGHAKFDKMYMAMYRLSDANHGGDA